jgi:hypothetical protein
MKVVRGMRARPKLFTMLASAALFLLNVYFCREVFYLDHFGQMQSIRGLWEGLAGLGHLSWRPEWWPYCYNGMPFEDAYAPGVPALIAAISRLTGWPGGRAFGVVAGFAFCFGPVALFWMAKEVTQRRGWSFVAALAYSLLSPSQVLIPEAEVHWRDPRRLMLVFAWDEAPHLLALAFVLLSVGFVVRGLRGGRLYFGLASVFLGLAMLTSAFGGTLGLCFLALVWLSWKEGNRVQNALWVGGCGVAAYLAICPFYPPSLLRIIRQNANLALGSGWTPASFWALFAVSLGTLLLFLLSRNWPAWHLRYSLLVTFVFFAIPFLDRWNLHFVPQPVRYKVELEVGVALLSVLSVALLSDHVRPRWRVALALVLLIPAVALVRSERRYAKTFIRKSDVQPTIEYQVASWLAANVPNQRVMAPGSTGFWMNAFTAQEQFTGASFPTIPTLTMQVATWGIVHLNPANSRRDVAKLWLQAYGVDALIVPGRQSPEFWKQFEEPAQFEELFPLLWRERDTSIYSVPRMHRSLASVVPRNRIVTHRPTSFFQLEEIGDYVAATEDPTSKATWQWKNNNTGFAHGDVPRGSVVSLHITYHPGWKAFANGSAAPVTADGLEQLVVAPDCDGQCEVQLVYGGGTEAKSTRLVSVLTVIAAATALWWLWATGRRSRSKFSV